MEGKKVKGGATRTPLGTQIPFTFHFPTFLRAQSAQESTSPRCCPGHRWFWPASSRSDWKSLAEVSAGMVKPYKPACTAGARRIFRFKERGRTRISILGRFGGLPQGTRPAFLLSHFRRPNWSSRFPPSGGSIRPNRNLPNGKFEKPLSSK